MLSTANRRRSAKEVECGESLRCAEFDVLDRDEYVRITVTDKFGKPANTNAYFVDDLKK